MKKKIIMTSIIVILLMIILFCIWQNNSLVISNYEYETSKIGEDLDGYRIVQISDLHNKSFGKDNERLIQKIKDCKPDMIVVTGDVVDSNHTNVDVAMKFMEQATTLAPVYYITGNHELWVEDKKYAEFTDRMAQSDVIWMKDEVIEITKGEESFTLIGLDDNSLGNSGSSGNSTLNHLLEEDSSKNNEKKLAILLAHEPQYFESYIKSDVDYIFTGHAHGGQIRLPGIGGLVAPDQGFLPKYTAGEFTENGTTMVVSRGLGNSIIPVRVFNRPEIVCVTLKK